MSHNASAIRYAQLGYIALNVTDLERSAQFYETIVGLTPVGEITNGRALFRCSDKHHDVVLHQAPAAGLKRVGWQMESSAARHAAFDHFAALGLEPRPAPEADTAPVGISVDAFRFREPNSGATFEFYSAMEPAPGPFVPTLAKIQRLGHLVLCVTDLRAAERFVIEEMNFRASDRIEGAVTFLRCFPNPFHHSLGLSQSPVCKFHHVNFMVTEVDDIGKAIWRMKKNGVPVTFGPGRHPPSDSMFFYFADPDGMWVEYSFGMEEFPEVAAREPRLLPMKLESIDYWGAAPDPAYPQKGEIEAEAVA
jgi:2,3-dihydroxy-p-cumate/2,3-dihydroxybenzoate 3,4-dioxygenase